MKRISDKRRKRLEETRAWRQDKREEIGLCEWCREFPPVLHEIPRAGVRSHVLDKACCILGLCDPGCHQIVGEWPKPKQLALLWIRRPEDYDLAEYNRWAVSRVWQDDVDKWIDTIMEKSQ